MAYSKDETISIARTFIDRIKTEYPIERAYLFGSYATGQNRDYSDIDLALICSIIDQSNSFLINKSIFHKAMLFNVDLQPICFSPEEFEKNELPIVHEIKQTGIEAFKDGPKSRTSKSKQKRRGTGKW